MGTISSVPYGVVALAPAHVGVVLDHLAQLQHSVHQRLRARRAARDVHVDRHELVGGDERVVVEDAHRGAAGAHRDRPLRLEHLVVDAAHDRRHLDRDAPGEDQQVGLARRGAEGLEAEARDVDAGRRRSTSSRSRSRPGRRSPGRRSSSAPTRPPCRASSSARVLRRNFSKLGALEVGGRVEALEVPPRSSWWEFRPAHAQGARRRSARALLSTRARPCARRRRRRRAAAR